MRPQRSVNVARAVSSPLLLLLSSEAAAAVALQYFNSCSGPDNYKNQDAIRRTLRNEQKYRLLISGPHHPAKGSCLHVAIRCMSECSILLPVLPLPILPPFPPLVGGVFWSASDAWGTIAAAARVWQKGNRNFRQLIC